MVQPLGNSKTKHDRVYLQIIFICIAVAILEIFLISYSILMMNVETPSADIMTVTATQLMEAYKKDPKAADETYTGKKMTVTGILVKKGQYHNSVNYYAVLYEKMEGELDDSVYFGIPGKRQTTYNLLKVGEEAKLTGECKGLIKFRDSKRSVVLIKQVD